MTKQHLEGMGSMQLQAVLGKLILLYFIISCSLFKVRSHPIVVTALYLSPFMMCPTTFVTCHEDNNPLGSLVVVLLAANVHTYLLIHLSVKRSTIDVTPLI
ncbi:hypothetical protein QTP88_012504 [Uroleucon formosanum]